MVKQMISAEELGITQKEHDAVVWTRDQLAKETIKYDPTNGDEAGNTFNMTSVVLGNECGTVACIAGWMGIYMLGLQPDAKGIYHVNTLEFDEQVRQEFKKHSCRKGPLSELFSPREIDNYAAIAAIDAGWAVSTIDHYLETGSIDWARCKPGATVTTE